MAKKGHSEEQILGALPRCRTSRRLTVLAADVGPRHALPPVGKRSHHEARTRAVVAFASLDQPHALQCFWKEQNVEHEGRNGSINQEGHIFDDRRDRRGERAVADWPPDQMASLMFFAFDAFCLALRLPTFLKYRHQKSVIFGTFGDHSWAFLHINRDDE